MRFRKPLAGIMLSVCQD